MYVPHFGLDSNASDPRELEAIKNGDIITGERFEKTEDFLIVDFLVNYNFVKHGENQFQIYAGVKNISNQIQARHDSGVYRDAGYIYGPCQPRTMNIGLRFGNAL